MNPSADQYHMADAQAQALKLLIKEHQQSNMNEESLMRYIASVKSRLEASEFDKFESILKSAKEPGCNCDAIISAVCELLRDHPDLILEFAMFLPPSYGLRLYAYINDAAEQSRIKSEAPGPKEHLNPTFQRECKMVKRAKRIAPDLNQNKIDVDQKDNEAKKPKCLDPVEYYSKVRERFKNKPEILDAFVKLLRSEKELYRVSEMTVEKKLYATIQVLFKGHNDLIEDFKAFVPDLGLQEKRPSLEQKVCEDERNPSCSENESEDEEKPEVSQKLEIPIFRDPSVAHVAKYDYQESHRFFEKIRAVLRYNEVYDNFLQSISLYCHNQVTRTELLEHVRTFIGHHPDLMAEFKRTLNFSEKGGDVEYIPIAVQRRERDPKKVAEIDVATARRGGTSYRALPERYAKANREGLAPEIKAVINTTWVSFPSWSEDTNFMTSHKTHYEETMYRIEDERFELDMAIDGNQYAIDLLESIQKKLDDMTPEQRATFKLLEGDVEFSECLLHKAFYRVYGEQTQPLINGLKKNTAVAVSILLKRLATKQEEWVEKRKYYNNIWRDETEEIFLKSLDVRGISFKQSDMKGIRPKALLCEMEEREIEKKLASPHFPEEPHFLLKVNDMDVLNDVLDLIRSHVKRLPGLYRLDRKRIENVLNKFLPDFYGIPRHEAIESEGEDDSKDTVTANSESEGRSKQSSPSCSNGGSRDDADSDQEESNSLEENEASEEKPKDLSMEDPDIFENLETIQSTNIPYILFLVNSHWYVFFRQFHIMCERLYELFKVHLDPNLVPYQRDNFQDDEDVKALNGQSPYSILLRKIGRLLSGAIDNSRFEDDARNLFGIHAYVSFTMDKIVVNAIRQLQQIIDDDHSQQGMSLFYKHIKNMSRISDISCKERAQFEMAYMKKMTDVSDECRFFKVLWMKETCSLIIEFIDNSSDFSESPYEGERWSSYINDFLSDEDSNEIESPDEFCLPVVLPRNLRKQIYYWNKKVFHREDLWKRHHLRHPASIRRKRKHADLSGSSGGVAQSTDNTQSLVKQACMSTVSPVDHDKQASVPSKPAPESPRVAQSANINRRKVSRFAVTPADKKDIPVFDVSSDEELTQPSASQKPTTVQNRAGVGTQNVQISPIKGLKRVVEVIQIDDDEEVVGKSVGQQDLEAMDCSDTPTASKNDIETPISNIDSSKLQVEIITIPSAPIAGVESTIQDGAVGTPATNMESTNESQSSVPMSIAVPESSEAQNEVIGTSSASPSKVQSSEDALPTRHECEIEDALTTSSSNTEDSNKNLNSSSDVKASMSDNSGESSCFDSQSGIESPMNLPAVVEIALLEVETSTEPSENEPEPPSGQFSTETSKNNVEDASLTNTSIAASSSNSKPKNTQSEVANVPLTSQQKSKTSSPTEIIDLVSDGETKPDEKAKKKQGRKRKIPDGQKSPFRKTYPKKFRSYSGYMKPVLKRNSNLRCARQNKQKARQKSDADGKIDPYFDYTYFKTLNQSQKCRYMALESVMDYDDTEVCFRKNDYRLNYVQNHCMYMYRRESLASARRNHRKISKPKTAKFKQWHLSWIEKCVTSVMWRSCMDWLYKCDRQQYQVTCTPINELDRPPYMTYNTYCIDNIDKSNTTT